ncbi:hypothetical protein [Neorhizobium sp. DT-125]|uniref:hypothetical protein n=1 Tax=Neorhizobium sp. DT-125 TaxID=3396163 RepID=UPI003F1A385B
MEVDAVIDNLKATKGPSRKLDSEIAQVLGWRLKTETFVDAATGETKQRHLWLVPKTDELGKIPFYTLDLEAAYRLTQDVAPSEAAGCMWEDGIASARIGDGPTVEAANAAIALCIAALVASKNRPQRP